jgi:hypothetical protein
MFGVQSNFARSGTAGLQLKSAFVVSLRLHQLQAGRKALSLFEDV